MRVRRLDDGIELSVRLTPKAAGDRVDGFRQIDSGVEVLAARVRAVPEGGKANAALEQLVAAWLGIAKSDVRIVSGHTARLKRMRLSGDPGDLARRVARLTRGADEERLPPEEDA